MVTGILERVRRALSELEERFRSGRRRGLVLTLLAVTRLQERGERVTPDSVAREARRIIREYQEDWGVSYDEYTPGLASSLLRELVEMGVLEELSEGGFALVRAGENHDPVAEVYARFGYLIFYGGPAR